MKIKFSFALYFIVPAANWSIFFHTTPIRILVIFLQIFNFYKF